MPWPFRDVRHSVEVEADERYAAVREGRVAETDITRAVSGAADRVRMFTDGIREGRRMNKLAEAAERIRAKKIAHDAKGDEWLKRLDDLDAREPGAFAAGDAAIEDREVDLSDMEATVRSLGNGAVSVKSSGG